MGLLHFYQKMNINIGKDRWLLIHSDATTSQTMNNTKLFIVPEPASVNKNKIAVAQMQKSKKSSGSHRCSPCFLY